MLRRGPQRTIHDYAEDSVCGRYTNTKAPEEIDEHFGVPIRADQGTRRFNIAPTEEVLGIVAPHGEPKAGLLRWGLVPWWAKDLKGAARMVPQTCPRACWHHDDIHALARRAPRPRWPARSPPYRRGARLVHRSRHRADRQPATGGYNARICSRRRQELKATCRCQNAFWSGGLSLRFDRFEDRLQTTLSFRVQRIDDCLRVLERIFRTSVGRD